MRRALRVAARPSRRAGQREILGRVDVEPEAGQAQHARRQPAWRAASRWLPNDGSPNLSAIASGGLSSAAFVPKPDSDGTKTTPRPAAERRARARSSSSGGGARHVARDGDEARRRRRGDRLALGEGDRLGVAAVGALGRGSAPRAGAPARSPSGSRVTTWTASSGAARARRARPRAWRRASSARSSADSTGTRRCLALTRSFTGTAANTAHAQHARGRARASATSAARARHDGGRRSPA